MEGPCDDRHTPAHSMMEAPMDVDDGAADISVADNLFGTSVTPPNLSVGADAAVAPGADEGRCEADGDGEGAHRREVGREVHFGIWKGCPIASKLPYQSVERKVGVTHPAAPVRTSPSNQEGERAQLPDYVGA